MIGASKKEYKGIPFLDGAIAKAFVHHKIKCLRYDSGYGPLPRSLLAYCPCLLQSWSRCLICCRFMSCNPFLTTSGANISAYLYWITKNITACSLAWSSGVAYFISYKLFAGAVFVIGRIVASKSFCKWLRRLFIYIYIIQGMVRGDLKTHYRISHFGPKRRWPNFQPFFVGDKISSIQLCTCTYSDRSKVERRFVLVVILWLVVWS